jgi:hypothetical protein
VLTIAPHVRSLRDPRELMYAIRRIPPDWHRPPSALLHRFPSASALRQGSQRCSSTSSPGQAKPKVSRATASGSFGWVGGSQGCSSEARTGTARGANIHDPRTSAQCRRRRWRRAVRARRRRMGMAMHLRSRRLDDLYAGRGRVHRAVVHLPALTGQPKPVPATGAWPATLPMASRLATLPCRAVRAVPIELAAPEMRTTAPLFRLRPEKPSSRDVRPRPRRGPSCQRRARPSTERAICRHMTARADQQSATACTTLPSCRRPAVTVLAVL